MLPNNKNSEGPSQTGRPFGSVGCSHRISDSGFASNESPQPEWMTLDERKLMDEMSRSILMTRAEIGLRSGFSKDKTTRILNALASRGLVAREGSGRGTRCRRV